MKLSFALVASALLFGASSASPLLADRDNRNGPVPVIVSISTTYNTPTSVSVEPSTTQEITPTTTQAEEAVPTTSASSSTRTRGPRPRTSTVSPSVSLSSSEVESSSSAQPSASPAARPPIDLDNYFIGGNSYYLHTIRDNDRHAILDAMQSVGMKTVRIFLTAVMQNNKGSDNPQVNDGQFSYLLGRIIAHNV